MELSQETVESNLLRFLDLTQSRFSNEPFPPDLKSKWLAYKASFLTPQTPSKRTFSSFKSEIDHTFRPRYFVHEKRESYSHEKKEATAHERRDSLDLGRPIDQQLQRPMSNSFAAEFRNLMKSVGENTKFYENLAFKGEKNVPGQTIDPLSFYTRVEFIPLEKK